MLSGEKSNSDIEKFDFKFQNKVLSLLCKDLEFLDQFSGILKAEYFSNTSSQKLFDIILKIWSKYQCLPTIEILLEEMVLIAGDDKSDILNLIEEVFLSEIESDKQYYIDRVSAFCQRQAALLGLRQAAEFLKTNELAAILPSMEKTMQSAQVVNPDFGLDYCNDSFKEEKDLDIPKVATLMGVPGSGGLDDILKGGLEEKSLGVIIMPTGRGKSVWLLNMAGNCVLQGLNAIYISLELSERKLSQRFNIFFSGISADDINYQKPDLVRNVIKENYSNIHLGNLLIKEFPTKSITVRELDSFLKLTEKKLGWKLNLLCIDYLDILKPYNRNKETYEQQEQIAEELRALAQRLSIPIWTASQPNRGATQKKIIDNDSVASSYSKLFVADVVLTANPSLHKDDNPSNITKFFVSKNRQGKDQVTIDFECDFERLRYNHIPNSSFNPQYLIKKGRM